MNEYWKSLDELTGEGGAAQEHDAPPAAGNRRDFLRAAGFSFATAVLAGCGQAPVQKAVPYLAKPEEVTPGRSLFYASTCGGCSAACGLLVKNRDGRPIKLEGNPEHPLSRGGLCAVGQASILGLYDTLRLKQPLKDGKQTTWEEADRSIAAQLDQVRRSGGAVRFLSGTVVSPTLRAAIGRFLSGFANARHVVYDSLSSSAILDAHQRTHGARVLPRYRFDKAEVIAGFDADFLGTWISPVEFTRRERAPDSWFVQFESRMSLTGSKADRRVRVAPGDLGLVLSHLAARIAKKAGAELSTAGLGESPVSARLLDRLAARLWQARGRSLVVCGSNDVSVQALVNWLNHTLGNYGATLDVERPSYQRQGNDSDFEALLAELQEGKVAALFLYDANPVYERGEAVARAIARVPLVVNLAERLDETASVSRYVCPDHHYLESWRDAEPAAGIVSVTQPAIHPFGNTRSALESFAVWSGKPEPARDLIRRHWAERFKGPDFEEFWERAVHDGHAELPAARPALSAPRFQVSLPVRDRGGAAAGQFALVLYPKAGILDGRHAYNPWLQELPDPVTKVTWDNYACLAPAAATRLQVAEGDVVRLEAGGKTIELPVYIQPGQHDGTVAVAVGYGKAGSERFAKINPQWLFAKRTVGEDGRVGKNIAPFAKERFASIVKTGKKHALACTQTHHYLTVPKHLAPPDSERRPIIQEIAPAELAKSAPPAKEKPELWPPDHPSPGHRWGMVVDLDACTGCSACVIACQVENNIPVVGKDEVSRKRAMHWMRIDRYYSGDGADVEVAHQPMMCQQCEHAPCETVCPVLATVHSEEGLNQQVYNRCVGTRYCENNCPYKARHFNWFAYARDDRFANLVLNPDVTVRSRGVMEKCTFCVQRIQERKIEAKRRGEPVADGDIQTACQQSCPARAIVFGDLNDPKSKVSQLMRSPRNYRVLEEINVRPSVGYLKIVRNHAEEDSNNG